MVNRERLNKTNMQRLILVGLAVLLQLSLIILLSGKVRNGAVYVYAIVQILSQIEIFSLVSKNRNSDYTIAWILVISFLPVAGYLLFMLWGRSGIRGVKSRDFKAAEEASRKHLSQNPEIKEGFALEFPQYKRLGQYLEQKGFPLHNNTNIKYYPLGELHFEAMLKDIEEAKEFIFLEYFILGDGVIWQKFETALIKKAAQGLEIRILYDDFGSIVTMPAEFLNRMKEHGIKVARFNPIHKYISRFYFNYRNHQKIAIIDGNIAYTGGTNISDEYANLYAKHGHWKDTAIRLEGEGVWSLTVTLLQMWDGQTDTKSDYSKYRPKAEPKISAKGYVQPFSDGPLNNPDNPAEFMYRSIISRAQEYVYMTTPYLVIDSSMAEALIGAAESGVDVRVITPKIGDHWYVHTVTRSNYSDLLKAGVKVYEYTPGYIHAKTIISDDNHAITGSINMDYRSFNLNFENGVWICGAPILADIKADIMDTLKISERIDLAEYIKRPFYIKAVEGFLRVFAVLF